MFPTSRSFVRTARSTHGSQTRYWLMAGACGHEGNAGVTVKEEERTKESKGPQRSPGSGSKRSRCKESKTQRAPRAKPFAHAVYERGCAGFDKAFQLQKCDGGAEARKDRHQYG